MKIWGIHKKYDALSWSTNFMGGHIAFGPVVIFGANAMDWVCQIRTKRWGVICFTLPVFARFKRFDQRKHGIKKLGWYFQWYFYLSPNGTPWAATYYIGSYSKQEQLLAEIRKFNFGHGFDSKKHKAALYALNHKFESMKIGDYEIEKWGDKDYNKEYFERN